MKIDYKLIHPIDLIAWSKSNITYEDIHHNYELEKTLIEAWEYPTERNDIEKRYIKSHTILRDEFKVLLELLKL